MDEFADYYSRLTKNREVFEKNFAADIATFKELLSRLREIWGRVGTVRALLGRSQAGLIFTLPWITEWANQFE